MLELDFTTQLGELRLQISLSLPTEHITAVSGVSDSGKTSLINVIEGLIHPDSGRVVLNGRVLVDREQRIFIPPERRQIGYVFQDARLFPHYRVRGNLQYAMPASMRGQFDTIVALLGLEPLMQRYPLTLSGGEKQRVAIGRALLSSTELLLMDEPLASLDKQRKQELLPYLNNLSREVSIPIIYVSHQQDEIEQLARYILILEQGG